MARYGAVFSQQGIDWRRANDYQKVMDSRWKFLDIHREQYVDVSFDLTGQPDGLKKLLIYRYSLPYTPAFEARLSSQTRSGDPFLNGPRSAENLRSYADGIYYVFYYQASFNYAAIRIKGFLRIYALDLRETYKAPSSVLTTAKSAPNARYGAKFLDPNRGGTNIRESDPRKYTLYTPAKQISIHMCGIQETVAGELPLTHDVGYPPSYMLCKAYDDNPNSGTPAPPGEIIYSPLYESFANARANANTITFRGVQSTLAGKYGYIIQKDPVEIAG